MSAPLLIDFHDGRGPQPMDETYPAFNDATDSEPAEVRSIAEIEQAFINSLSAEHRASYFHLRMMQALHRNAQAIERVAAQLDCQNGRAQS